MSLFNEIAKTKVEKRYEQIKEKSPKILLGEKNRCKATFDLMWNDMSLEEAQELIDMMGAEAVQAFQMHAKINDVTSQPVDGLMSLSDGLHRVLSEFGTNSGFLKE